MSASTKPYNIQSPEQIAKDCGYNKQVIAKCMQTGTVEPTAGVLAGLFIDRVRNAEQAGQGPTQTIAQQIFAPPAPPAGGIGMPPPPAPPQGAPAGLGATPEAAQMPAPEMGMAAPAPEMPAPEMPAPVEEAPMGMAEGGLAALPLPDTMFDEPNNGSYADGGIVAFARGGYNDFHKAIIAQESGGRYGIPNAQGSGAMGVGQLMPDTARAIAKRIGLPYNPDLLAGTDEKSRKYQDTLSAEATKEAWTYAKGNPQLAAQYYFAGPDKSGWGPKTQRYGSDIVSRLGGEAAPMPREADTTTAAGRGMSLEDQIAFANSMYAGLPREAMDRAKAAKLEELDPENIAKEKRYNDSKAIIAAGLDLMSGGENYKGENALGSIARAGAVWLNSSGESRKEQKAAKNAAVRELMALEDMDRKTAIAGVELGMEAYKVGLTAEQQQRALAFQEKQLSTTVSENAKDREVQMAAAMYRAQNPSDFDTKFAMYQKSYPGFSEVAILKQMKTDGLLGSSQAGMALPGVDGEMGGAGDANSGMSIVGSRPVQ
jgi:hypothetical protein